MEYAKHDRRGGFSSSPSSLPKVAGELRNTQEAELLAKEGWAMRAFPSGCAHEIADHRTVGLKENFGHRDIQIFLPMNGQLALGILGTIAELVISGKQFKGGDTSDDVLEDLTVKFIDVSVNGAEMLRVILPDKQGRVERGQLAVPYSNQYLEL